MVLLFFRDNTEGVG